MFVVQCSSFLNSFISCISTSEVATLWHYTNLFIIIKVTVKSVELTRSTHNSIQLQYCMSLYFCVFWIAKFKLGTYDLLSHIDISDYIL